MWSNNVLIANLEMGLGPPSQSNNYSTVDIKTDIFLSLESPDSEPDSKPDSELESEDSQPPSTKTTHHDNAGCSSTPPRHSKPLPPVADPNVAYQILKPHQAFCKVPTAIKRPYNPEHSTRIACISDTHGKHRHVRVPRCDVLLHGGDFTRSGEHRLVKDVDAYFDQLLTGDDIRTHNSSPSPLSSRNGSVGEIICIAGNHDITLQPETYASNWKTFHPINGPLDTNITRGLLTNCTYLQDASHVSNGIKYYGSPWSPEYGYGWAFNLKRHEIHQKWDLIPSDTDVLITHGPPLGRGDLCFTGTRAGCVNLLQQVQNRVQPRIHLFGHIHEDYGVTSDGTTLFINASNCSLKYTPDNPCIVIDLPHDKALPALVIKPQCTLEGEDVISLLKSMCDRQVVYCKLVPFFEGTKPLIQGKDLVVDDVSFVDIGCQLGMFSEKNWLELKSALRDFVMDLRTLSY